MTIERQLSKVQGRTVLALAEQREALVKQLAEINEALNEQAELLRVNFGLPEGKYDFFGDTNGIKLMLRGGQQDAGGPQGEDGSG
jgi:hypothetical protein